MGNEHRKLSCTQENVDNQSLSEKTDVDKVSVDDIQLENGGSTALQNMRQITVDVETSQSLVGTFNAKNRQNETASCEITHNSIATSNQQHANGFLGNHDICEENQISEQREEDSKHFSVNQNNTQGLHVSDSQHKLSTNAEKTTLKVPPSPRYNSGYFTDQQKNSKFSSAVCRQNEVATTAIQSLDSLSEQIVQYIVSIQNPSPQDGHLRAFHETVSTSLVLIRKLLLDAQLRFRKMVDDNKLLATHIDNSIQTANQEVSMLRAELASTNRRLGEINLHEDVGKVNKATQTDKAFNTVWQRVQEKCDTEKEELKATIQTLTRGNEQLIEDYKHLLEEHDQLKRTHEDVKRANESMKAEISRLESLPQNSGREVVQQAEVGAGQAITKPSYGEIKLELIQARQELNRAKEVLQDMKSDRKRLKGEKLDLLSQMKQLYATLEEKETELRDFIRNYEQRVKESDEMFAKEKEDVEKEKWEIITKAKDAAERAMFFKAQLDAKEQSIKDLEAELKEAKQQLDSSNSSKLSSSTAAAGDGNIIINDVDEDDDEVFPSVDGTGFSTMEESSVLNCIFTQDQENGQALSVSPISNTDSLDASGSMFKWFTHSSDFELPVETRSSKRKKKSFSSLSRVFSRSRMRRSIALPNTENILTDDSSQKLCVLSQDNYQEKLNTIEKMVGVHMRDWRAPQVLAWLEITLAMPMYAQNCLTNVKSGRVLLGLSDNELSTALGVTSPMHRRKLRLAIEQHRNPDEIKYLKASEMDPTWIAHRFLPDLGLPQYTDVFEEQLCDGHVLNTLTRRDLEKYFSVHRKFHQSSILHAVELLRRIEFNKEKLYHRRNQSEDKDTDLIIWTNERLMKWIRKIDLGEYCDSLVESGVHGALIVLEPSFNADTLASILGIPPSKSYIRRHLSSELDGILKPARTALDSTDSKERGGDSSLSSPDSTRASSGSQDQQGSEDRGRRRSEEEGRALLAELLGRKYETT